MNVNSIVWKAITLTANMKVIIALALFAVAFAEEVHVVHLPRAPAPAYEMPDISPVYVPQEVLNAVKIGQPVLREEVNENMKVHVVDSPIAIPEAVKVVDFAEPAMVPQPVRLPAAPQPAFEGIRIVDAFIRGKHYNDPRLR